MSIKSASTLSVLSSDGETWDMLGAVRSSFWSHENRDDGSCLKLPDDREKCFLQGIPEPHYARFELEALQHGLFVLMDEMRERTNSGQYQERRQFQLASQGYVATFDGFFDFEQNMPMGWRVRVLDVREIGINESPAP